MPAFGLMPMSYRVIGVVVFLTVLAGGSAALAWRFQDWRYGRQLAEQAKLHTEVLNQLTLAAATQQQTEQDKRLALEQRLSTSEQTHYRALSDVQRDQGRLRDRLATADVRLSVLLVAHDAASVCAVPTASGASRVDHGTCLLYTSPSPRDRTRSRMPSSA